MRGCNFFVNTSVARLLLINGIIFILLISACRKNDINMSAEGVKSEPVEKFFYAYTSSDLTVQSVFAFLKRKNDKEHFVKTTVDRI